MIKLPFKFEDCISPISPFEVSGNKNCIVIYSIDSEQYNGAEESIIRGYLDSAKRIVDSIYRDYAEPAPQHDLLVLPLLSLYSCALEFCLKLLKKKLEEHRENKTCSTIAKPKNSVSPFTHNLCGLSKTVESLLPTKGKIHHFENFTEILDFIKNVDKSGITLESTRYLHDINNTKHSLHTQQSYIIPDKLNETITYICHKILNYINNPEFNLCETQEFSQEKLNELKCIALIMSEVEPKFLKHNQKKPPQKNYTGIITISNIDFDKIPRDKEFFEKELSTLDHKKLAALVMGLYYSRSAETITENLSGFEKWDKNTLKKKVLERLHLFEEAYNELKKHLTYIETTIKNRL